MPAQAEYIDAKPWPITERQILTPSGPAFQMLSDGSVWWSQTMTAASSNGDVKNAPAACACVMSCSNGSRVRGKAHIFVCRSVAHHVRVSPTGEFQNDVEYLARQDSGCPQLHPSNPREALALAKRRQRSSHARRQGGVAARATYTDDQLANRLGRRLSQPSTGMSARFNVLGEFAVPNRWSL